MTFSKTFNAILLYSAIGGATSCTNEKSLELVTANQNTPEQQSIYSMDLLNRFMYLVTEGVKRSVDNSLILPFRCAIFTMYYQGNAENFVQFVFKDSCPELDGNIFEGTVTFYVSEISPGEYSIHDVSTDDLSINGIGIVAYMNFFYSTNQNIVTTLEFELAILPWDSSSITIEGSPDFTWLNSYDNDPSNDQFEFSGDISFVFGGNKYSTLELSSPLNYSVTCQFPLSGIASCQPDSGVSQYLNLGNKGCDNRFNATSDNYMKVEEIPAF